MAVDGHLVTSMHQVRELYGEPGEGVLLKELDHLDAHCRALIAHSPFVVVATASAAGRCDASPKGGPPGFVTVLDDHGVPTPVVQTKLVAPGTRLGPADDVDGAPVTPLPAWLGAVGRRAVSDAYDDPRAMVGYEPDVALVNLYDETARMGMHQDRDERSGAPVVSLSIGNSCVFRFGNTVNRNRPSTDLELRSGDAFVFGGPSRLAYHGVPRTFPGTGDPAAGLTAGRLNITLRVTGLGG